MLNRRSYPYLLAAILFAVIAGLWQNPNVLSLAHLVSEIFVRLLKLISLPIISLSILATISSVGEYSLSQIGKKIVAYTIFTTTIAASIALLAYSIIQPIAVVPLENTIDAVTISYYDEFLKIIPSNLIQPFLEGNVISIMLLSILIGFGIASLPKEQRQPLHQLLQSLFSIMLQITRWIVNLIPLAIWGFMTTFLVEVSNGLELKNIGWYLLTIIVANLIQAIIVLPFLLKSQGVPAWQAFRNMLPALSFAFFSKSSAAAIPVAIECAENKMNVDKQVARFSFPLCTSINMNACAAFILITVLFVAQSNGVHFTLSQKLSWIMIATIAAIGNAGVPMGCYFIASALLTTMNIPLALMGIILPFYALLDMLESAINVWSDACVTLVVNKKMPQTKEIVADSELSLNE